jgi:predicted dehydrogenase
MKQRELGFRHPQLGAATLVVNLTPPAAHAQVTGDFLDARKHVYTEKPLATTLADARSILATAAQHSLRTGAAPDWLLSRSARAARAALKAGRIGEPVAASAFITHGRLERWHPDPRGFFLPGTGPVFDLALLRQRTRSHTGAGSHRSGAPDDGAGNATGDRATIAWWTPWMCTCRHTQRRFWIYGTEGTLNLPMPHERDDAVKVKTHDDEQWRELDLPDGEDYVRGVGVVDMARALSTGATVQASGALGYPVLEVLSAVDSSSADRRLVPMLGLAAVEASGRVPAN